MGICELKVWVDVGDSTSMEVSTSLGVSAHWESQPSGMSVLALALGIYLSNFSSSGQDVVNASYGGSCSGT